MESSAGSSQESSKTEKNISDIAQSGSPLIDSSGFVNMSMLREFAAVARQFETLDMEVMKGTKASDKVPLVKDTLMTMTIDLKNDFVALNKDIESAKEAKLSSILEKNWTINSTSPQLSIQLIMCISQILSIMSSPMELLPDNDECQRMLDSIESKDVTLSGKLKHLMDFLTLVKDAGTGNL